MRKAFLIALSTFLLISHASIILAQDAPNINVTKRRPDRPANYSPTPSAPVGVDYHPPVQPEVKQVQTTKQPFLLKFWLSIRNFFRNLFK